MNLISINLSCAHGDVIKQEHGQTPKGATYSPSAYRIGFALLHLVFVGQSPLLRVGVPGLGQVEVGESVRARGGRDAGRSPVGHGAIVACDLNSYL